MKLSQLEKRIKTIREKVKGDPDVVVDLDVNGYFDLENAHVAETEDGDVVVNLRSSNEA